MKLFICLIILLLICLAKTNAQNDSMRINQYLDIHRLEPGSVKFADVAGAHQKDLLVQGKYKVNFLKYWVDEGSGLVYCLSSANDSNAVKETHREAHGLLPAEILSVREGFEGKEEAGKLFFLDIHELGAGKVTAEDVATAHERDLQVQAKHGVNFINYWVDEKRGVVVCLSQAANAEDIIATHKEAHGLLPHSIKAVKQGK